MFYNIYGGRYRHADASSTLTDCLWVNALVVGWNTTDSNCTRRMLLSHWRVASFLDLESLEPATLSVWCHRAQCCQSSERGPWHVRLKRDCHHVGGSHTFNYCPSRNMMFKISTTRMCAQSTAEGITNVSWVTLWYTHTVPEGLWDISPTYLLQNQLERRSLNGS
jgi:hypothetical protein